MPYEDREETVPHEIELTLATRGKIQNSADKAEGGRWVRLRYACWCATGLSVLVILVLLARGRKK